MDKHDFSGIEVSAEELIVAVEREERTISLERFANDAQGHQAVLRFLRGAGRRVRVCMESTGVYGLDLALLLARAGIELMVANPREARHFATAMMQRSKNDRLDARMLLEFAKRMPFQAWTPPPVVLQLHALSRRLQALKDTQAAEQNRLHAARATDTSPAAVRRDLERSLRSLRRAVARLTVEAVKIIRQDSGLQQRFHLLLSAKGIGETSAMALLAELAVAPQDLDVRQLVAYAGLDPREHSSGSSVHKQPRLSKHGNVHLRRALYMPALVALRRQPHRRAFYEHLRARGKAKMVALVAVMRKLLHAIFGMFKHRTAFDGNKLYPAPRSRNLHNKGRRLMPKRKVSCTFERKKPLEVQERIYPHEFSPGQLCVGRHRPFPLPRQEQWRERSFYLSEVENRSTLWLGIRSQGAPAARLSGSIVWRTTPRPTASRGICTRA